MQFSIEFYRTAAGKCPMLAFLEDLKASAPDDHAAVLAGLERWKDRGHHRPPLCKPLGQGLLELRHIGQLNTRVLWFFTAGRRIVAVHGIRHKAQAIPSQDIELARERRRDWIARRGHAKD